MIKIILTLLVINLFIFNAHSALSQATERKIAPYSCEYNIRTLDTLHQVAQGEEVIIAIARLGDGENRSDLNKRRLHNVREYLTSQIYWKRNPKTVITAEGERVKGYGRVEFYAKGILFDVLAVKRNGDLLVGSCEPDDIRPKSDAIFYPLHNSKVSTSKKRINH